MKQVLNFVNANQQDILDDGGFHLGSDESGVIDFLENVAGFVARDPPLP